LDQFHTRTAWFTEAAAAALVAPADRPPQTIGRQGGAGGGGTGRPVHSSARVAARRRQIEPTDRRRGSPPTGHRAEDQLLVKLRGAAVDGTPNEVGVAGFHPLWAHHVPGQDQVPETGGPLLDPLLDTGGKRLQLVRA